MLIIINLIKKNVWNSVFQYKTKQKWVCSSSSKNN